MTITLNGESREFEDSGIPVPDLIEKLGGREAALKLGAPGATPPPEV